MRKGKMHFFTQYPLPGVCLGQMTKLEKDRQKESG